MKLTNLPFIGKHKGKNQIDQGLIPVVKEALPCYDI